MTLNIFSPDWLSSFWTRDFIDANLIVFVNLFGALVLGMLVGYERAYHGRAAGMRTYGLVCMASAALTVFVGYPEYWYGGQGPHVTGTDPTRVVQGIVTGIGFLGAGIIMKDGMSISGLTTAASVWASCVIGVLVGVGFYFAAILLALLSAALMMWGSRLEMHLPSRHAIGVVLHFVENYLPTEDYLINLLHVHGFDLARQSVSIQIDRGCSEWRFVAVAKDRHSDISMPSLATLFRSLPEIDRVQLAHARN